MLKEKRETILQSPKRIFSVLYSEMDFLACKILPFSHIPIVLSRKTAKLRWCPKWDNQFSSKKYNLGAVSSNIQPIVKDEMQMEILESKEEDKQRFRWVRVGPDFTEYQKQAISKIQPQISNRCKALMQQIICYTPEKGMLSDLLAVWVKRMKPRRTDWLLVLKELSRLEHPLYLEVAQLALFEESFEASVRDYTKIIDAFAKESKLLEAERTLHEMKERGFVCDQIILTTLVHMYSKVGNLKLAECTFEEMKLMGEPLDQRSYGSMVMAYTRATMLNQAESLIKEMEAEGTYAKKEVYKALLRAYSMNGDSEGAQRVFVAAQVAGIVPDAKWCALLINAYALAGQGSEACIAFGNLRRSGLEPNDKCVALVLSVYERENKLNKALDFLVELERDGYLLGKEASEMLAKWFRRLGVVEEVELVLRDYAVNMDQ